MEVKFLDVNLQCSIKAPPARVFAALTTGIDIWWGTPYFERQNETRDLVLEPKIGGRFYERWGITGSEEGALLGSVTAIKSGELLRLEGPFGITEGVVHGKVTFALEPAGSGTLIKFSHQAAGNIGPELELRYAREWTDLLARLKLLVEEGKADGIIHDPSLDEV